MDCFWGSHGQIMQYYSLGNWIMIGGSKIMICGSISYFIHESYDNLSLCRL